jgi:hypothetical protein
MLRRIFSTSLKRDIESLKYSGVAERLIKALHGSQLEQTWTGGLISVSCDEDRWNISTSETQLLQQLWSRHAWHGNIKNQTSDLAQSSEERKAPAEANAWTVKPHSLSNVGSDSRMDSSSSTTATSAWVDSEKYFRSHLRGDIEAARQDR